MFNPLIRQEEKSTTKNVSCFACKCQTPIIWIHLSRNHLFTIPNWGGLYINKYKVLWICIWQKSIILSDSLIMSDKIVIISITIVIKRKLCIKDVISSNWFRSIVARFIIINRFHHEVLCDNEVASQIFNIFIAGTIIPNLRIASNYFQGKRSLLIDICVPIFDSIIVSYWFKIWAKNFF